MSLFSILLGRFKPVVEEPIVERIGPAVEKPDTSSPISIEHEYAAGKLRLLTTPLGTVQFNHSNFLFRKTWLKLHCTVLVDELIIKRVGASGPHNPKIMGVKAGQKLPKGKKFLIQCAAGPLNPHLNGGLSTRDTNYMVEAHGYGVIINTNLQVNFKR